MYEPRDDASGYFVDETFQRDHREEERGDNGAAEGRRDLRNVYLYTVIVYARSLLRSVWIISRASWRLQLSADIGNPIF